ncbi:hypothetical protein Bca101_018751 [Brassica carinata]
MDISTLEKFLSDSVPLRKTKDQKYLRKYNLRDWLFRGCIEQRQGPVRPKTLKHLLKRRSQICVRSCRRRKKCFHDA